MIPLRADEISQVFWEAYPDPQQTDQLEQDAPCQYTPSIPILPYSKRAVLPISNIQRSTLMKQAE